MVSSVPLIWPYYSYILCYSPELHHCSRFSRGPAFPFSLHEMSSVQDMNQFGVMNEDVVEEVNLGIENGVMKSTDGFRKGNDGLVCKSDELETGDFAAGTAPGWQGEGQHRD